MALPPLIGEHDLTIDERNRLLFPAVWRRALEAEKAGNGDKAAGKEFVLMTGTNGKLWLYPQPAYEVLVGQVQRFGIPTPEQQKLAMMVFAKATPIALDKQNRLLIPEKSLRRTNTGKDVAVLGLGDHMEIWNREEWERYDEELTPQMGHIAAKVRQDELYEQSIKNG
ncbi:MAG: hypothetical protein AAGD32_03485 [Planctomycetota bacterium]